MINNITGFHIEPTNICTVKCPGCARTRFIEQWPQHWKNYSIDIDSVMKFLDIDLSDKHVALCGNYGDPIYHPDLIELVRQLKLRKAVVTITTNGSYKQREWWEKLVELLDSKDKIEFSVDGIPENFTQYRINADWESILTGMTVVADARCHSVWKYLPFAFNQDNIEQAKQLSIDIGIKDFRVEPTERFDDVTQHLVPDPQFLSSRYQPQVIWKSTKDTIGVNPRCQQGWDYFITADGYYAPCCHLADHRFYYKTIFGKNKKMYDIRQHTFTEILQQEQVINFYQTLDQHPGCQYNCPKTAG